MWLISSPQGCVRVRRIECVAREQLGRRGMHVSTCLATLVGPAFTWKTRAHTPHTYYTRHFILPAVAVCAAPTRVPTRVTAAKTLTVVCFLVCPRPRPRPSCEEIKKDTEGLQEFDSRLHMMNKERGAVQDRFDENKRWSDAFDKQIGPFEDRYLNLTSEISGLYDNAKKEHAAGINFLVRLVVCVGRV